MKSISVKATSFIPYDEDLLERARDQWKFGDWSSLCRIERTSLQHHPEKAKLALLVSAGHLQKGHIEIARQFIQLAIDWGCNKKLLSKILIAGVYNSLARAAAQTDDHARVINHIQKSVTYGSGSGDINLLVRARMAEQFMQLGLPLTIKFEQDNNKDIKVFETVETPSGSPILLDCFFSGEESDRTHSLVQFKKKIEHSQSEYKLPDVDCSIARHKEKDYWFVHFHGDYIPSKMAEKNQFYEFIYLNLLARLHKQGKLILDCGANIGNHTVFFAGVMGADVIAFEPQDYNYEFLVANIYLNKLEKKVDARKKAIGMKEGVISLVKAISDNYGSYTSDLTKSLEAINKENSASFDNVILSTIDRELNDYKFDVSIIKLDIEGMELDALHGARDVIACSLPVIAVECFTKSLFVELRNFLSEFEYFVIDSANATPTFIFLTRKNPDHLERLSKYLERYSVSKFSSNKTFNEIN